MDQYEDEYKKPYILTPYQKQLLEHLLPQYCHQRMSQDSMVDALHNLGIPVAKRSLQRHLAEQNLTNSPSMTPAQKQVAYGILRRHYILGDTKHIALCAINDTYDIPINMHNINQMSKDMGLNWRRDDIQEGRVTPNDLVDILLEHIEGEDRNAGYRTMQQHLAVDDSLRIHQETVRRLVKIIDPNGVALRTAGKLKRRLFYVPGPNHLWASDGHDKLKPFGITIYGFIDAWSRKVLSLHVATSNNDPRRIGLQYLELVRDLGGFPERTSTDHGSETVDMATLQTLMHHYFCGEELNEAHKHHLFTTSQHNQKIESLWSQLMRCKNTVLRDEINAKIREGVYNPSHPVQKALFLHLWVPLVQRAMDSFVQRKNTYRTRKNHESQLPTGVSPDTCYNSPSNYNGSQGLNPVPRDVIDNLIATKYPDSEELKRVSAPVFGWQVSKLIARLGYDENSINLQNVWVIFTRVLGLLSHLQFNPYE